MGFTVCKSAAEPVLVTPKGYVKKITEEIERHLFSVPCHPSFFAGVGGGARHPRARVRPCLPQVATNDNRRQQTKCGIPSGRHHGGDRPGRHPHFRWVLVVAMIRQTLNG
jgi:hypothetical protein